MFSDNFPVTQAVPTSRHVRGLTLTIGLCALLVAGAAYAVGEREPVSDARRVAAGPDVLARAVTAQRLRAHLRALAAIARQNGGSRDAGGRGYQQSVAYIAGQLRRGGLPTAAPLVRV